MRHTALALVQRHVALGSGLAYLWLESVTKAVSIIDVISDRLSDEPGAGLTTFLNPYSYLYFRTVPTLLLPFDQICVDGGGLVAALVAIGIKSKRASFDYGSIAQGFFERRIDMGHTVAIVGAQLGYHDLAVQAISKRHPRLKVIATRHGFFSNLKERRRFVLELRDANPDVVVAGMGTPLQEIFLSELKEAGWAGVGVTCGGFLHQTAIGRGDYYPGWANRAGLRALYRAARESHVRERLLKDYPRFPFCFLADSLAAGRTFRRPTEGEVCAERGETSV
jgi:exopolysaccharide biosynthesis WecB/TagA/CpsF family protein